MALDLVLVLFAILFYLLFLLLQVGLAKWIQSKYSVNQFWDHPKNKNLDKKSPCQRETARSNPGGFCFIKTFYQNN